MNKRIYFHTNLDEAQRDVHGLNTIGHQYEWHQDFGVPAVGTEIRFEFERDGRKAYCLQVCAVTYDVKRQTIDVELHMPRAPHQSIREWTEWIKRHRDGRAW